MAAFNYKIKSQTYALVLEKMRESLRGGRLSEGKEWLARALELCGQLEKYSSVAQLKERYAAEYRSLAELQISLRQGKNPLLEQRDRAQSSSAKREENSSQSFSFAVPAVKLKDVAGLEEVKRQIRLRVIAPPRAESGFILPVYGRGGLPHTPVRPSRVRKILCGRGNRRRTRLRLCCSRCRGTARKICGGRPEKVGKPLSRGG